MMLWAKGHDELEAVRYVLENCRDRDLAEMNATGDPAQIALAVLEMWPNAAARGVFYRPNGEPAAFAMFYPITPAALTASLIATPHFREVWLDVLRWRKGTVEHLSNRGFRRAECRAIEGHADAEAFLLHIGFVVEAVIPDFGRNGERFTQFAWRLSDHVFHAENSGGAGDAAAAGRERRR